MKNPFRKKEPAKVQYLVRAPLEIVAEADEIYGPVVPAMSADARMTAHPSGRRRGPDGRFIPKGA